MKKNPSSNKYLFFFCVYLGFFCKTFAQSDSTQKVRYSSSGYFECYYLLDFGQPENNFRPPFYYNHNNSNIPSINIGMINTTVQKGKIKAAAGLMMGSYVSSNLANELNFFKNIYEANATILLNDKKNIGLQAGIINSHLGFESVIGADCFTLTRSIAAENSPYYETAIKFFGKSQNKHYEFNLLLLNGWQKMPRFKSTFTPAIGAQVIYSNNKVIINNSNYFGNEGTINAPIWRYFHNFYIIANLNKKGKLIVGIDLGFQQVSKNIKPFFWYTSQAVYKHQLTKKFDLAYRIENYKDKNEVITAVPAESYVDAWAQSLNFDFKLNSNVLIRVEYKALYNVDSIFMRKKLPSRYNNSITSAISLKF
ncbi:MAG TPA: outer membrane beta-barrel protein [Bacteroidia bacterium]|nr:outer membrane beta-barrel protein [Bacteroidia bacterium]